MTKRITYKTEGTCSQFIDVEIDEQGILTDVNFIGGCNGNLQGICALVRGMRVDDIKKDFQEFDVDKRIPVALISCVRR